MLVNFTADLSNSAGEAATAKSLEKTDDESACTFFAEMGQIWNLNNGNNGAQVEEESSEQIIAATFDNPLGLLLESSLLSAKPLEEPMARLNSSGPFPRAFKDSNVSEANTPDITHAQTACDGSNSPIFFASPDPIQARTSMPDSSPVVRRNLHDIVSKSVCSGTVFFRQSDSRISADAMSSPDSRVSRIQPLQFRPDLPSPSESNAETKGLSFVGENCLSRNSNPQKGSLQATILGELEALPSAKHMDAGNVPAIQDASCNESIPWTAKENAQPDSRIRQTTPLEFRQGLHPQPESNAMSGAPNPAGDIPMSRDPDKQNGGSPDAFKKSGDTQHAALENSNRGGSHANQDASQSQSVMWMFAQSKSEGFQSGSDQPRTARQEEISSQYVSGPARMTESGGDMIPNPSEAAVSQSREFILQLAERIQIQLRDGRSEIRVQLKPDGLGHLEIRAEATVHGVIARIVAESNSVKGYLKENLHLLQQSLQDQGLKINRIHIVAQNSLDSQSSLGYATQFGHAGTGYNGAAPHRFPKVPESMSANQPEEIAVDPVTWISLHPNASFHTIA